MENINKFKKVAVLASKRAGCVLLNKFRNFDLDKIKFKSSHEIVSSADYEAEKVILEIVKKNFSNHGVLSEESGGNHIKSDYLWIIDPLDGSTNFSRHNPFFAVSIGLAYKKEIILGVIYSPVLKELYVTEEGKKSSLNNRKIKVSNININSKAFNTFCHCKKEKDILRAVKYYQKQKISGFDCRQLGSASLELAYIASGRIESFVMTGANSWDVAAGVLLVRNAGGKVTDFSGKNWTLSSYDLLASNGKVHDQIMKKLSKM